MWTVIKLMLTIVAYKIKCICNIDILLRTTVTVILYGMPLNAAVSDFQLTNQ